MIEKNQYCDTFYLITIIVNYYITNFVFTFCVLCFCSLSLPNASIRVYWISVTRTATYDVYVHVGTWIHMAHTSIRRVCSSNRMNTHDTYNVNTYTYGQAHENTWHVQRHDMNVRTGTIMHMTCTATWRVGSVSHMNTHDTYSDKDVYVRSAAWIHMTRTATRPVC